MMYQLRVRKDQGLNGLFLELIRSLEQAIGRPLPLELQGAVARDMEKHVFSWDTCGCSALCDEATSPARWNTGYDPILLSMEPTEREAIVRLHLQLPGDSLERFAGAIGRYLDQAMEGGSPERREAAERAVFTVLSPHLFLGEICKKAEICKSAEPVAVSIAVPTRA